LKILLQKKALRLAFFEDLDVVFQFIIAESFTKSKFEILIGP
jgi:hypothetical protein